MSTHDSGAAMVDEIDEVVRRQPIVQWNKDRADLRDCIKGFELRMGVGCDVSYPVTLLYTQRLQGRRPAVTTVEELTVTQPQIAIDHSLPFGIEPAGTTCKFQGG